MRMVTDAMRLFSKDSIGSPSYCRRKGSLAAQLASKTRALAKQTHHSPLLVGRQCTTLRKSHMRYGSCLHALFNALSRHPSAGGVAINNRFVLTAAHCFKAYHPSAMPSYSFAMGHHKRQQTSFVSQAKRLVLHETYNSNGRMINDIALIELERTIDFRNDTLGFVCLPLKHVNDGFAYPPLGQAT